MSRIIPAFSLFILLAISTELKAQFPGMAARGPAIKGKITGSVMDSLTKQPVGFATISLRKEGSAKILNGALTEDNGKFSFTDIAPGKYDLEVSFLGYNVRLIEGVETTGKSPDKNVGNIFLVPTDYMLEEVQVTAKRELFENKVDRIVFNAADDSSISGGDATDVLRKVPNLSVDLDGNVSIRGSQNVRILINGKPSGMFSANIADALKMFPADQIDKVEVITSPGAKYDAEGSGGIINIVTKKKNIEGVAGSVNASVGNLQNNAFVNLNMGRGRFGSTINGSVFYSVPVDGTFSFERTDRIDGGNRSLIQNGINNSSRLGFNGSGSAFYDFNAYNSINTSFTTRGAGFDQKGNFTGALTAPGGVGFNFTRNQLTQNLNAGFDWNTDYTKKFEKNEGQELTFAYQLSRNVSDQDISLTEVNSIALLSRVEDIINDGTNIEHTIQVDYTHPVGKGHKIETGAKAVIRDIISDFTYSRLDPSTNQFQIDPNRSNYFTYDQDVLAGYAQYSFPISKFQFIAGLRYEHTDIGGRTVGREFDFENSYANWVPNFTIARPLSNFRNLRFSYSKRIQRPSLIFVNPFNNSTDQNNVTIGNPLLNPEITHQYEVGYNTRVLGFNIFGSGYFKRTNDIIEQTLGINEQGISVNSYDNVGIRNSFGINAFVNKSINKFNLRFGGDIFTYDGRGVVNGEALTNTDINYQLFTNGEYSFSGTIKADMFGFFRSQQTTLQGRTPSFSIFGIGIRKDLKDWSLGIRIIEPFEFRKEFNSEQAGEKFNQVSTFAIPFRSFGVNVRYKFGKVDFRERRTKIRNTDTKAGEDATGGGQQGGATGGGRS